MNRIALHTGTVAAAMAGAMALVACNSNPRTTRAADTTASAASGYATPANTTSSAGALAGTNGPDTTTQNGSHTDWTPTDILAYLSAATSGEATTAKLAESRATDPSVKAFAHKVATQQNALQHKTRQLASQLKLNVASATNSDIQDRAQNAKNRMNDLRTAKAGKDWDQNFINDQIDAHQDLISKMDDFNKAAMDGSLQAALQQVATQQQAQLQAAQDLKNKLGS
ncbi:MAG: DUF4142 domain-containing protein [Gemmatimonadaceae bacterium]